MFKIRNKTLLFSCAILLVIGFILPSAAVAAIPKAKLLKTSPSQILTPSGYKKVSDVKVGDEVAAYDLKTGQQVINTIKRIDVTEPENYEYFEQDSKGNNTKKVRPEFTFYLINNKYKIYKNQSLWVNNRAVHGFEVNVGDSIYDDKGKPIKVTSVKKITTQKQWVEFIISGNHSYIMDGLLLHNASRYWVGGGSSVNWNATGNTNWGSASNTQDNASVPTSSDDVFFDGVGVGASNSTLSAAITIRSLDMTGYTNTLTHNSSVTLSIGDATAGAGNNALIFGSLTYTLGSATTSAVSFISTSTTQQNVNFNNKTAGNITFNGSGGSWKLTGTLSSGSTSSVTLTNGALDINGQIMSIGSLSSSNSNTRTLALGSLSTITIAGTGTAWDLTTTTNMTFSDGSNISVTGAGVTFAGGGKTYNNVSLSGSGTSVITGANTFATFSRSSTAVKTDGLQLNDNQIVTTGLTLSGNSATNRLLIKSDTLGTSRTITNNAILGITASNVDFRDITGAGTASWDLSGITGKSGDAGGNSGITFTTAAAQTWSGTSGGNWSANAWTTRVPLPQDNVTINAAFSASQTVTADMPRLGKSIDWTGASGSPTFDISSISNTIYGSLTLISGMTLTADTDDLIFEGRSSFTLTSATRTFGDVTMQMMGGTLTLQDDLILDSSNTFTLSNGTFDANGKNVTLGALEASGVNNRTITMGAGTWALTGNGRTIWNTTIVTGLTFNNGNAIVCNYSGSTGTRTISSGGAEGSVPSFNVTAGSDTFAPADITTNILNLDFTGFSGTLANSARKLYGNLTISSGMTVAAGSSTTTFAATSGTKTITSNGKTLDFPITFNGVGGTWSLADAMVVGSTRTVVLTNGTFTANNQNITMGKFSSSNSNTRVITMGSGTWTLNGTGTVWTTATTTGLTLNENTSTIKITDTSNTANTFSGGGEAFNNIWWSRGASTASNTIAGSNTFADFKDDGSAAHSILFTAGTTQTVTTFTVSGTAGNVITINSDTTATHALTKSGGGTISSDYLNIQHSVATPSSTWYAGVNSTDNQSVATAGSGWIFTAPPSGSTIGGTVYTNEGVTNIGANKTVAVSVNGAAAAGTDDTDASGVFSIPNITTVANDVLTLYIDGETEQGVTVTKATGSDQTSLHIFQNYLITRCDNSCSLTNANINTADGNGDADITAIISAASDTAITTASGKSIYIPASHTFAPGGTVSVGGSWTDVGTFTHGSSTVTFTATATGKTITTTGSSFYNLTFDGVGGGWAFQDNPTIANTLTVTNGSLDANGADITVANVSSSNSNTRTINMGTGTWTLNGTGTVWTTATTTNLSLTESTSTIAITDTSATGKTFSGGGETFGTITFSGDNITVVGSNTFSTFNLNNAGLTNGLKLTSGTTQTVTTFTSNGSLGSLAKLVSTSGGSAATLSKTSGTVREDYMSIQDSTATGGATWYAGANSTNVSGNTGWIFTAAPTSNGKFIFRGDMKFRGDFKFR